MRLYFLYKLKTSQMKDVCNSYMSSYCFEYECCGLHFHFSVDPTKMIMQHE